VHLLTRNCECPAGAGRRHGEIPSRTGLDNASDDGFTLVELLIVIVIMPLIIGALSIGLFSVFSLQSSVTGRITDSGNAQVVSSLFLKDVQSAALITEQPSPPRCGSAMSPAPLQTQLLGLAWNGSGNSPSGYSNFVSYVWEAEGSNHYSLLRQYCTGGSTVATDTINLVSDLDVVPVDVPHTVPPTCLPTSVCSSAILVGGWVSTAGVSEVTFPIVETQSVIPGSSAPSELWLSASPRTPSGSSGGSPGFPSFAPLTVLGTAGGSCGHQSPAGAVYNQVGNSSNSLVSVSAVAGSNGSMAVGTTCDSSIVWGNNATIGVNEIFSEDPSQPTPENLSLGAASGGRTLPPQGYTTQILDPFTTPVPPSTTPPFQAPSKPSTNGNCGPAVTGVSTCTPGYYGFDPGTLSVNTLRFQGGVYYFGAGLTLGPNATTVNGAGVLFYIPSGSLSFGGGTYTLPGLAAYDYMAIWDNAASNYANGWSNALTFTVNNYTYAGGGIYDPKGGILDTSNSNNSSITAKFMVVGWANFQNNVQIVVGP
jgi:prepilin-type N-terminal cleavage/methylation domain-containing protein